MRLPLHTRMALGLAAGVSLGLLAHWGAAGTPWLESLLRWVIQPVGRIFLNLLFMLVVPLIFSALALGVAGMGDLRGLGRVGVAEVDITLKSGWEPPMERKLRRVRRAWDAQRAPTL